MFDRYITKIGNAATGLAMASMLLSCSDDYLDRAPITSKSAAVIANSIEGARGAKDGLLCSMYRQMSSDQTKMWGTNGEAWMDYLYGEIMGQALISQHYAAWDLGWCDWMQYRDENMWGSVEMWFYGYIMINWANLIIENIDQLEPYDGERDYIKATALAMRAHAYTKLLQVYAPNWENSDEGNVKCIIIRTSSSTEPKAFGTMREALDLIYSDLRQAITLFDECGWKREQIWELDGNIARGIFARAAAICHDYTLCEQMAREARAGYPIMSADEYRAGFIVANDEYMWSHTFDPSLIKFYAYGTYNACNGRYQSTWTSTALNAIDYRLYSKFPSSDIRKGLYLAPDMIELNSELASQYGVTPADFFDGDLCDNSNGYDIRVNNLNTNMRDFIIQYGKNEFERIGKIFPFSSGTLAPYQRKDAIIAFGAQYKFWGDTEYGTDQVPFMRASEMGYLEAEMACRNGNEPRAREIMNELNKDVRDPNYNCTATGEALLQEIKDYRQFELWGEGFNWYDFKRWHDPIVRVEWEAGNPESGNYGVGYSQTFGPDDYYGWVVCVPLSEFNTNTAARRDELPGSNR